MLLPRVFGSKSTISRFGERFRDGQYTVWYKFLFAVLLLTVIPYGVGATVHTALRSL